MEYDRLTAECDWIRWRAEKNRAIDFTSRPSNELLFLHGISYPTHHFPGMFDRKTAMPESVMINSILLQAAAAMLEELKERLSCSFDVTMATDVFTEWKEIECMSWPSGKADVLASWRIEHVAKRNARIAAARAEQIRLKELADVERFEEVFGCPLEVFLTAVIEADARKAARPAPSAHGRLNSISKKLKKGGYSRMTPGTVEYCRAILQRHRPDLVPTPAPPSQAADLPGAKVLPFKKLNGADGPPGDDQGAA